MWLSGGLIVLLFCRCNQRKDKDKLDNQAKWKDYLQLTKPGIIRSNLITAVAGFLLASQGHFHWMSFIWMLVGVSLVMASACVFNNYLDREHDLKMERTQHRVLPTGRLKPSRVLLFGSILGIAGLIVLLFLVNLLCALLGLLGMIVYVIIYTLWLKRSSTWSTSVGGISGAMPPVIGYCAVTHEIDAGAWILFAILFLWQPPHFWALGIRRMEEYRAAGYPLLPVVKGVYRTKLQMIPYLAALFPATYLLKHYGYVSNIYFIPAILLLLLWALTSISGFWTNNNDRWAKRAFMMSIYYLTFSFVIMAVDSVIKNL